MFFKPKKVIVLDQETVQTSVSSSQDTEQTIDITVNDSSQTSSSFSQNTDRTIDCSYVESFCKTEVWNNLGIEICV